MAAQHEVLIVEDVAANVALYRAVLERAGYGVEIAGDGETAERLATSKAYDLIVMDIGLPGIDGAEAARRIRASGAAGALAPIIALTADDDAHVRRACKEAGMNAYLAKPLSPAALLKQVAELVR